MNMQRRIASGTDVGLPALTGAPVPAPNIPFAPTFAAATSALLTPADGNSWRDGDLPDALNADDSAGFSARAVLYAGLACKRFSVSRDY